MYGTEPEGRFGCPHLYAKILQATDRFHRGLEIPPRDVVDGAQGGFLELGMGRTGGVATQKQALYPEDVAGSENGSHIERTAQVVQYEIQGQLGQPAIGFLRDLRIVTADLEVRLHVPGPVPHRSVILR